MLLLLARGLADQAAFADITVEVLRPKQQDRCPGPGNLVVVRYEARDERGAVVDKPWRALRFVLGAGAAPHGLDHVVGQMCVGERVRALVRRADGAWLALDAELVDFK